MLKYIATTIVVGFVAERVRDLYEYLLVKYDPDTHEEYISAEMDRMANKLEDFLTRQTRVYNLVHGSTDTEQESATEESDPVKEFFNKTQ